MRRPARLVRVVAQHRTLLPVQRLDRGIDVPNPLVRRQQAEGAVTQMPLHPVRRRRVLFRRVAQCAPQRVFRQHPAHPQHPGIHAIIAQRRDMRVAAVTGQHRQQPRAQNVLLARRVRTRVSQRAVGKPALPQPGRVQKLDEVRQLPQRRGRRALIPQHPNPAGRKLQTAGLRQFPVRHVPLANGLTHRVTSPRLNNPLSHQHFPTRAAWQVPLLG